jgi:hypothetical protein
MPRAPRYTIDDLRKAVETSTSYAQVLAKLGLRPAGGNYKYLRERLSAHGIDFSHFTHQGWSNGVKVGPKRAVEEYLTDKPQIRTISNRLKLRLIREGIFQARCSACGLTEWMGRPIPLELDHINGVNTDNRIENLRLLCPNCHAQTPNYRGKNKGTYV